VLSPSGGLVNHPEHENLLQTTFRIFCRPKTPLDGIINSFLKM
jgi:hypothetical protein